MGQSSVSSFDSERTTATSSVVLEIVQRDPHFLGKSEERRPQQANRDDEEKTGPGFVPETEERAAERHYNEQCRGYPAAERQVCRIRQQSFPTLQARDIGLELDPRAIILGDIVEAADAVDDGCRPRDQNRDEAGHGTEKKGRRDRMRDDLGELLAVQRLRALSLNAPASVHLDDHGRACGQQLGRRANAQKPHRWIWSRVKAASDIFFMQASFSALPGAPSCAQRPCAVSVRHFS